MFVCFFWNCACLEQLFQRSACVALLLIVLIVFFELLNFELWRIKVHGKYFDRYKRELTAWADGCIVKVAINKFHGFPDDVDYFQMMVLILFYFLLLQ